MEWTLTLLRELPPWEFESRWTPKCLENNFRGQNPMDSKDLYTIENLLKRKCVKWACITHLDIQNTSYGQKKGRKSNWYFDSRPLKVKNRSNFLTCRWCVTHHWKALKKGLQLCFRPHFNWKSARKVMGPQSCGSPNLGNFGTFIWESQDKMRFRCGPCEEAQNIL
jgi:hypothetical protein